MDPVTAHDSAAEETDGRPTGSIHISNGQAFHRYHGLPAKPVVDPAKIFQAMPPDGSALADDSVFQVDRSGPGRDLDFGVADLPPEILQHIFSYVDPISLGRLLFVNRLFNVLLDPTKPLPPPSSNSNALRLRPQNDVWISARRNHTSTCPRPMEDMSEIDMWRLIHGTRCQFCSRKPKNRTPLLAMAASPWSSGPGPEGVRTIWPFRCRACGPCLEARIVKETDLLLSSKSVLLSGLPFALFTPSLNHVTSVTLRQTQPPPRLQLSKCYFKPQIDDLDQHQVEVRSFGAAALQEWYKGLDTRGQTQMKEAARFEQWQVGNRSPSRVDPVATGLVSGSTSPAYSMASSALYSHQLNMESPYRPFSAQSTPIHPGFPAVPQQHAPGTFAIPLPSHGIAPGHSTQSNHSLGSPFPNQHVGSGPLALPAAAHPRKERNFQEIDRLKSERRAEIRRRCLDLNPPIQPSTLDFMDAFNAAVQIARPLNDNDWVVLRSRLLTQRGEAEQKERQHCAATLASQMKTEERHKFDEECRHAQENADRTWTEIQKPSRDKAREYADDYIKAHWADGRAVNKAASGMFAADVLMHVRRHYYEMLGQEDTLLASQSMTIPPDSPIHEIRRLKLEDMKYVYEETIRPRIDRFGREVFLCSTCETNAKRFTFDAVIQHYAAKHTSALSHGNAVVYWKADWPTEPPFHPAPDTAWNRPPEHRPMFQPFGATSPAYTPAYTPYPGASWMSPLAPGQPNGIYHVQCEELVASAKRIWDAIDEIRYLPDSLRLYVVIHQVARSFSRRFTNEPTLSMFSECVNHKPLLKPLRDLMGFVCRACRAYGESSGDTSEERGLPDLLQHYQTIHVEHDARSPQSNFTYPGSVSGISAHRLDWKFDMVDLPPESVIRGIVRLPGMDQQKLEMIAEVLPSFFPAPLPHIDPVPPPGQDYLTRRPQLPFTEAQAFGSIDFKISSKRPLDEDPYSYPPPLRRVVEYDPFRSEVSPTERYPLDTRPRQYVETAPQGRVVYVDRSYLARPYEIEARPFPRPHTGPTSYVAPGSFDDRLGPHIIHEVADDYARDPRSHDHHFEPIPDPVEPRGQLDLPTRSQEDQYRPHEDGPSRAEHFLNTFDTDSTGAYEDEVRPDVRLSSRSRLADRENHPHVTTPARTPVRSQQNVEPPYDRESRSRRQSPRPEPPARLRSRNESPIPPLDGEAGIPGHEDYAFLPQGAVRRSQDNLALSPVPGGRSTGRHSGQRSPVQRSDRHSSPRGEGAVPYEYDHYADERSSIPRQPLYSRQPASPEVHYRRYEVQRPTRYIETLPNGRRRMVEELPSPTSERLEYVGAPDREPYYMDSGYVIQHPPPPPRGYRVERELDGHGYTRARPYEVTRSYPQYGYDPGPSTHGLHLPELHGLRMVKYEDEISDENEGR